MILGLTGGVGSGKSTVTGLLKNEYGYTILHTDDIAKELEQPGNCCYEQIVRSFGESILKDGKTGNPIDNPSLAALIYSDPDALEIINGIVHPAVWKYVEDRIEELRCQIETNSPEVDIRAAVETALPGDRLREICDKLIFIYTDKEVRIERLAATRGYSREKSISVIEGQLSDESFRAMSDYVVDNSGSREDTERQMRKLLEEIEA